LIEKSKHPIIEHILNFFSGSKRDLWHKPVPISPSYQAYTTQFDRVCDGRELEIVLGKPSRDADDAYLAAKAMFELAMSLLRDWNNQKIISVMESFRCLLAERRTIVSLLVDHSGSMRGEHIQIALAACAVWGKILSDAGAKVEVLGFTTSSWQGGQSRELWLQNGKVPSPGRLCDLLHVVHRPAETEGAWSDEPLLKMLTPNLLKENIDGEAIMWAERRLLQHSDANRILVVVSDGAPVDDSTLDSNPAAFLENHIMQQISRIQSENNIQIGAIGINHKVERYYKYSVAMQESIISDELELLLKNLLNNFKDNAAPPRD
jgi:cobaltochelatase CobT